jgi:hypothetical protein
MTSVRRRRRRAILLPLVTAATLVGTLASCADDGPTATSATTGTTAEAAPAGATSVVGTGRAPVPDDAVPYADPVVDGATTTQSFRVAGRDPAQVIDDYQSLAENAGWTADGPPASTGSTDYELTMHDGNSSLRATTAPANGDAASTELSLQVTDA